MGPASADYATVLAHVPGSAAPWYSAQALPHLWTAALDLGIDPLVMCAQTAVETGWGTFDGAIDASWNNTCGLKVRDARGDRPEDHARFADLATGCRAHACHLLAYATTGPLPAWNPDPRSDFVPRGAAPTVQDLSGLWAPSRTYGQDIAAIVHRLRGEA